MKKLRLGIVGATGMVGETFLELLEERKTPIGELRLFASEQSLGKKIKWRDQEVSLAVLSPGCFKDLDVVFFSSGDDISKEWAPLAVQDGAFAIDNSAAYRMDANTALVVPEINMSHIKNPQLPQVIANPNCSTIQLVMALEPLKKFGLEAIHVACYQSVSGAGKEAMMDLTQQSSDRIQSGEAKAGKNFVRPIAFDCHPIIGSLDADGFCSEENKIVSETKKILSLPSLKVSAFTVRVPTYISHAEAVWVTLKEKCDRSIVIAALRAFDGIIVDDTPTGFPSLQETQGKNQVFVSRIRQSRDFPNTWMMWVVADNIRRGAATNGLFIAEQLFK
jgi:aspartate-semialdehyde dehydrogenase